MWGVNGSSMLTQATLSNSGNQWHAIGTGDFNGDGKSDILYQNSNGTPLVWDMNGTSVVSTATYPNPGSAWILKDDGPIQPGSGPQGHAAHDGNADGNADGNIAIAVAPPSVALAQNADGNIANADGNIAINADGNTGRLPLFGLHT